MDLPLFAIDTETATLGAPPHLLEVAAVRLEGGEAAEHFATLVCPLVPIEEDATRIHGLAEDDVRDAPQAREALRSLFEFTGQDALLLAHDAKKDAHVLAFECARHGIEPPSLGLVDTLALARRAFPEAPDHRLVTLIEHLELDVPRLHRALPDAVACWQLFEAALARLGDGIPESAAQLYRLAGVPLQLQRALPGRPGKRPSIVRTLESARAENAEVELVYGAKDGSPSTPRVRPGLVYRGKDHGYLEGECLSSGLLKTYRIDRIQRVRVLS